MLVPKEMKVEYSDGVKALTDEQLDAAIAAIQAQLEAPTTMRIQARVRSSDR
jgi:hypothetical protein